MFRSIPAPAGPASDAAAGARHRIYEVRHRLHALSSMSSLGEFFGVSAEDRGYRRLWIARFRGGDQRVDDRKKALAVCYISPGR